MALRKVLKVSRKTFFNPAAWLDVDTISRNTAGIWAIVKGLITPVKPTRTESFEEAKQRLGLTEADIYSAKFNYLSYAVFFFVLGILMVIFSGYLLVVHFSFSGAILALAASGLLFTQALRFHFYYFQIKWRKLGCTWEEWLKGKPNDTNDKGTST